MRAPTSRSAQSTASAINSYSRETGLPHPAAPFVGAVAASGGMGRVVLLHADRRDQRRGGRRARSSCRSDRQAGSGRTGTSRSGGRGQQRLFPARSVAPICRRTAPRTLFRRGDFHSRTRRQGAGPRAAQGVPRRRGAMARTDGDDSDHREGRPPGVDPPVDGLPLPLPADDDPAGHGHRALPHDAAALRPAAVARRLHRGGAECAAGRRDLRHGVPETQRCRAPLCRAGRVVVRAAETVHRQRLARDADSAGGLPQPVGNAGRRCACAHRGAVGRDRQGAADAGLPRAAQPFAAAAVEDRQRPVPRGRRGRRERTGAPHG